MKWWIGICYLVTCVSSTLAMETHFSGEIEMAFRHFSEEGLYQEQTQNEPFLRMRPHYSMLWDHGRKSIDLEFTLLYHASDEEKARFDIREASFVGGEGNLEFRVGISNVFWGVTESQHLVDIINQTDLSLDLSGEEKLGQPMLSTSYISEEYGVFSGFLLPYFRERIFPGKKSRLRSPIVVDTDHPQYESEDRERHLDYAFRWSHYIDELEWGISYFRGTDREPVLVFHDSRLIPVYKQMVQVGLDAQYVYDNWLFKLEALQKQRAEEDRYVASTIGFEYTWYSFWEEIDLGLLYEHLRDDRGEANTPSLENHSFMATRIALNDIQDSQVLIGSFFDNSNSRFLLSRIEGSRRINNNWKWSAEGLFFHEMEEDEIFYAIRQDGYWQGSISYFW